MKRTGRQRIIPLVLMNVKEYHTGSMITSNYSGAYYDREAGQPITFSNEMKVSMQICCRTIFAKTLTL